METRIAALAVALVSVCIAPMPEARAQSSACSPPAAFDPTNPASAGFNLVFSDDFTNPQTIDLSATGNAGFNWYRTKFFGYSTDASVIAFTPDGLVLTPTSVTGSYNIATAAPANNPQGYVGKAFGVGGYFEAKIKFDPTTVNFSQGFPAFWGFSIEHAANMGADHPAGTPAGFQHFIEDDFFEFDISWASSIAYGTAIHDWYGIYASTCLEGYRNGSPGFCDVTNNGLGTPYNNFVSTKQNNATIDWTKWHIIGQLWVPGTYAQNFIDGQPAYAGSGNFAPLSKTGWTDLPSAFIDPLNSPTAFSVLDSDHLMIILGSGLGQPFTVRYVRVWQIPGCAK